MFGRIKWEYKSAIGETKNDLERWFGTILFIFSEVFVDRVTRVIMHKYARNHPFKTDRNISLLSHLDKWIACLNLFSY